MNATPKVVIRCVFGWCIIVAFVVLLTVIFSFLGTIICAALAGMMMGSARLPRWHCLLASLIFPAVISTVLRVSRSELMAHQVMLLSVLCFAIFWCIYGVMAALGSREGIPREKGSGVEEALNGADTGSGDSLPLAGPPGLAGQQSLPGSGELTLSSLQGVWLRKDPAQAMPVLGPVLEIQNETAVLTILDAHGAVSSTAQARLRLTGTVSPSVPATARPILELRPEFVI